jgi:hypothetical protein
MCAKRPDKTSETVTVPFASVVRPPDPRFRSERWIVALVVVVGGLLVASWSRDMWFHSDVWDFLALRQITDLESIIRPHFGHWQVPAAIQTRVLYGLAGMEFWPIHYLPRAIGWAGFSVFSWWVMRRRGAHPVAALGALGVTTVLATSYYFQAAHIGALIAICCALGAALLIDVRVEPTNRDRMGLFGLMLLAVMSAGIGVASLIGITVGLLIVRRFKRWIVPVAAAGLVYAMWFLGFDLIDNAQAQAARNPLQVPWASVVSVKNVLVNLTGLPDVVGWPLLALAVGGLVWLVVKRRLTVFDVLALACAAVYIGLVSRTRVSVDRGAVATNVFLLLAPVFVPHLALTRRRVLVGAGLVFAVFAISHGIRLESGIDERIAMIDEGRPTIESMASLIRRGDSFAPDLKLTDLSGSSQLTLRGIDRLVQEGWDPRPSTAEDDAVVRLRVSLFSQATEHRALIEPLAGTYREEKRCMVARDGEPIIVRVDGSADLGIRVAPKMDVVVTWSDDEAQGSTILTKIRRQEREVFVNGPDGPATISFAPSAEAVRIELCGVDRFVAK